MRHYVWPLLVGLVGCRLQTETVSGPQGHQGAVGPQGPPGDAGAPGERGLPGESSPTDGGNADTVGGLDASSFMRADTDTGTSGTLSAAGFSTVVGTLPVPLGGVLVPTTVFCLLPFGFAKVLVTFNAPGRTVAREFTAAHGGSALGADNGITQIGPAIIDFNQIPGADVVVTNPTGCIQIATTGAQPSDGIVHYNVTVFEMK
jgi:hypothetical protein